MKGTKPILTSDQVNYLIWRYLQEIGNGDAARYLQRDWTEQNPQDLPFARHVQHHALVLLLQKGLLYHELETTSITDGSRVAYEPSMYFFGPESGPTQSAAPAKGASNSNAAGGGTDQSPAKAPAADAANGRKHARESMIHDSANANGPSTGMSSLLANLGTQRKRARRSANGSQQNGTSRPPSRASSGVDPMEIDQNGYGRAAGAGVEHPEQQTLASSPAGGHGSLDADGDMGMGMGTLPVKSSSMRPSMGAAAGVGAGVSEPATHTDQGRIASPHLRSPEPAPLLSLTNGRSWGAPDQPAKVTELGPETTILGHAANNNNNNSRGVAGDHPQHVTQTLWHPRDPSLLATIGSDFCRTWQLSNKRTNSDAPWPQHHDLIAPSVGKQVTAVAWDTVGEKLAVAVFESLTNQVAIYNGQGAIVDVLPGAQGYINHLIWRRDGAQLFGIMLGESDTSLVLWDMSDAADVSRSKVTVSGAAMIDAAWTGSDLIYTCGENMVWRFRAGVEISTEPSIKSPEDEHTWSVIRCSDTTMETIAATVDEAESPTIWIPTHDIFERGIHQAQISDMEFGADFSGPVGLLKRLATASLDGTVKVWSIDLEAKQLSCLHRLPMVNESPVFTSSLSPDGYFVAAASHDKVRIWNMERGVHVADWSGHGTGWKANEDHAMQNGDGSDHNPHSGYQLTWDSDGKKLALAHKHQVAVIDFQR